MRCKNIECSNETTGKKIYCSFSCRNIFVNKYLRNYDRYSDVCKQKKKEKEMEYLKSPKKCKECDNIIPYENRNNIYCNHSCSATSTNKERIHTWGDKISNSIDKYLDSKPEVKSKRMGKDRMYEIKCGCGDIFYNRRSEVKYCSDNCRRKFRKNRSVSENVEYKQYRTLSNFNFNLSDYSEEFDFLLVEKYGWYSPSNKKNNLGGVSRDHMLSVNEGFKLGIDPKLIGHPANCRLIIHSDNISKNKKSIISFEELLDRIKRFNDKYQI